MWRNSFVTIATNLSITYFSLRFTWEETEAQRSYVISKVHTVRSTNRTYTPDTRDHTPNRCFALPPHPNISFYYKKFDSPDLFLAIFSLSHKVILKRSSEYFWFSLTQHILLKPSSASGKFNIGTGTLGLRRGFLLLFVEY